MKAWKLTYGVVGILLFAMILVTGEYGLSATDKEIYSRAVQLSTEEIGISFPNFSVENYAVRFYNGSRDYVVSPSGIRKEEAVLDTFVGTALEVDGVYQVLVPTYRKMSDFYHLLETAALSGSSDSFAAFDATSYTEESHIATIWHEAFHIYEEENFADEIEYLTEQIPQGEDRESILLSTVDSNPSYEALFTKEMEWLKAAIDADSDEDSKQYIAKALQTEKEMKPLITDEARADILLLENGEGTAQYVESMVYKTLSGTSDYEAYYMGEFRYSNGSGKYYTSGMYKCLLLDRFFPNWQETFHMNEELSAMLASCLADD